MECEKPAVQKERFISEAAQRSYTHERMHALRARFLFGQMETGFFTGKRILEIGPFHGWFTRALLDLGAAHVYAVEIRPDCVEFMHERFAQEIITHRVRVVEADIHRHLLTLECGQEDIIVCAGFLYHSPHLFWMLENMARLRPAHILIETFLIEPKRAREIDLEARDLINRKGGRQSLEPVLPFSYSISRAVLIEGMEALGYRVLSELDRTRVAPQKFDQPAVSEQYAQWLKNQTSIWFERIPSEP